METVIRNRHERLLSLCNTDVVDTENMLCSYKIKLAILGKLQSSIKNYIQNFYNSNIDYKTNIIEFRKLFSWNYFIKQIFNLNQEL